MKKEPWSGNINFWFVVYGLSQFLARGNSCRKFLGRGGSWWLVVGRGSSWWLVEGRSGSYDLLDSTHKQRATKEERLAGRKVLIIVNLTT